MKLTEKQIEAISKTAVATALEFMVNEKEKQEKRKHDRRLRNVKLLLKNYRSFALHVEDIKQDIQELNAVLELDELDTDEFAIESIKRSKQRTLAIVKFINKMLKVYKTICMQSGNPDEIRKYETIDFLYICENKKTADEISEMHFLSKRMVYKNVDKACETLVVLIFGVDGVRFK